MQQSAAPEQKNKNEHKMMKRISLVLVMLGVAFAAAAQQKSIYEQKYDLLVSKFGPAGVGVETVLDNWSKADSTDVKLLYARFSYFFNKAQSSKVVIKKEKKYLGMEPLLALKDSTGADIFYYEESAFDDDLYGQALKAADRAISLYPDKLDFRFLKINAYIAYEKESPDMALASLIDLLDENSKRTSPWSYDGSDAEAGFFEEAVQEYCFSFWTIGSKSSYEAFRTLSEAALRYYPDNVGFMNNMGSYHLVACDDSKTALKWYNKVLKKKPDDYNAIKNCVTLARKQNNMKLEKKYLQMMVKYGPEKDKMLAQSRLQAISK